MSSRSLRSMGLYVLLPLVIAGLVVGLAVYISMTGRADAASDKLANRASAAQELHSSQRFACPVALKDEVPKQERADLEHHAEELMQAKDFEKALAAYRELGGMDPAYPGVNLDISMALSKLKRMEAAKQAIDAQLALSMCMAQLFPNELEPYCKAEKLGSTAECVKELGSIQQGAYIQAALVQMDLEHGAADGPLKKSLPEVQQVAAVPHLEAVPAPAIEPRAVAVARVAEAPAAKALPVSGKVPSASGKVPSASGKASPASGKAASDLLVARRDEPAVKPKRVVPPGGSSLASGAGTDSALGAYTK